MLSNFGQKSLIVKEFDVFVLLLPAEGMSSFFKGGSTSGGGPGVVRMRV